MKRSRNVTISFFVAVFGFTFFSVSLAENVFAEAIPLDVSRFKHIQFKGVPATVYENQKMNGSQILRMKVASSSSFLVLPFESPKTISSFKVLWNLKGSTKVQNHEEEIRKSGDDFPLRIGFALFGPKPWIPFLAPTWVKLLGDSLKHPSDQLIYYVLGSRAKNLDQWVSPYSASMKYIALNSVEGSPWKSTQHKLSPPLKVVGVWIMADGDQKSSSFEVEMGQFEIE